MHLCQEKLNLLFESIELINILGISGIFFFFFLLTKNVTSLSPRSRFADQTILPDEDSPYIHT